MFRFVPWHFSIFPISYRFSLCIFEGIQFEDESTVSFVVDECESASSRNVGTWREVTYHRESNWMQIENYGDVDHPMYLCLASMNDAFCEIGSDVELTSCIYQQDIENEQWISKQTQFEYDTNIDKIRLIGCDGNEHEDLCIDIAKESEHEGNTVVLTVANCDDATTFKERHFFP